MKGKAFAVAGFCTALIVGCMSYDEFRDARFENAARHFDKSRETEFDGARLMTLEECVSYAVKNNVDLRVLDLEEKVAKEAKTAEVLGMLPELNVSDNLTGRNNTPASSSRQVDGQAGPGTYSYSQSQDKDVNYVNIDLALSVMDFGLAYFNSAQAQDREFIRRQRAIRATQNLTLETVKLYFQVAASQRAVEQTKGMLDSCTNRYELIDSMAKSGRISPFRAFDETRRFTEMERRLSNFTRAYDSARSQLRSLMGLYPNTEIRVDDGILDRVPEFALPAIDLMEQIALAKRPDLMEIDMQRHINVNECRKTILMMCPNVRIFYDFTDSNNSFLYNRSWSEVGLRAAYNLLKLPQQIARYQSYATQVEAEDERAYAQAIAVMAQVRMACADLASSKERFAIDERINASYTNNLAKAEGAKKVSGELSNLELAHMRMATAETTIERSISLGNYYIAYFRLLNTLAMDDLEQESVNAVVKDLEAGRTRVEAETESERESAPAEAGSAETESEK